MLVTGLVELQSTLYTPFFCYEGSSSAAFNDCFEDQTAGGPDCDEEDFDPRRYGYEVSKISVNQTTMIKTWFDENNCAQPEEAGPNIPKIRSLEVTYPNAHHRPQILPHNILYESDELVGSLRSKPAVGVIPMCEKSCNPFFKWYKDAAMYESGENLMILLNLPLTEKASS